MSMTDPIADMLTRIRNGLQAEKKQVQMPASTVKVAIAKVLEAEGYVSGSQVDENDGKPLLLIDLKYFEGRPAIEKVDRVSRPGQRIYRGKDNMPSIIGGLGVAIVSTSMGIMTEKSAQKKGVGGEILCSVF